MKEDRIIPTQLQVVAVLFLLGGIGSTIAMIVQLASGSVFIDFGFLGIPAFFGLRRFSAWWRTFALCCIWFAFVSIGFAFVISLVVFVMEFFPQTSAYFDLFGFHISSIPPIYLSIFAIPLFLLEFWQYRVLTSPQVRGLFWPS